MANMEEFTKPITLAVSVDHRVKWCGTMVAVNSAQFTQIHVKPQYNTKNILIFHFSGHC